MSAGTPSKKNAVYTFYVGLISQADTKLLQNNPTLAAGDVQVSTDSGAFGNLATLPVVTPSSSDAVLVSLSAGEMNGDDIKVVFSDAAGAQWCDQFIHIKTVTRQIDDLAFPATSGRSFVVETDGMVHGDLKEWLGTAPLALTAQRVEGLVGAMAANVLTAAAINAAAITSGKFAAGAINAAAIAANAIEAAKINAAAITAAKFGAGAVNAAALATDAVAKIRDAILPEANVALSNIPFLLVAASDHVTPVTGATGLAVTRSIDSGAFGAGTGTITEVADGIYQYDASQADMNGGVITFRFVATGGTPGAADDRFVTIVTGTGV